MQRIICAFVAMLLTTGNSVRADATPAGIEIGPPVGSSIGLSQPDFAGSHSFSATNRIATTSYFYWYDVEEYGRTYLELNRKYVKMFKDGVVPSRPRGPFTDGHCLNIWLALTNREDGLSQLDCPDGITAPATVGGCSCRGIVPTAQAGRYIYFKIDDSFKWTPKMAVSLTVEYYDAAPGQLRVEFDGSDLNAPFRGAYSPSPNAVTLVGSKIWKTATFPLTNAVFANSQNGRADFRLSVSATEFYIRKLQLVRPGLRAGRYSQTNGFEVALFGEADHHYEIQASTNLLDWRPVTRLRSEICAQPFTDPAAKHTAYGWYRARPVP